MLKNEFHSLTELDRWTDASGIFVQPAERLQYVVSAEGAHETLLAGGQNGENSSQKVSTLYSYFMYVQISSANVRITLTLSNDAFVSICSSVSSTLDESFMPTTR